MGASWSGAAKDDGTYDSTHDDDASAAKTKGERGVYCVVQMTCTES